MGFIQVADTSDLASNKMKMIQAEGKEILLANIDGAFYAVDNRCSHMGGSLANGTLEGHTVTCPRHGTCFDLRSGKLVGEGKLLLFKVHPTDIASYKVKVEGTAILIDLP